MPSTKTTPRTLSVPSTRNRRASSSSGADPYATRPRLPSDSSTSSPGPSSSGVTNPRSFAASSNAPPMSPTFSDVTTTFSPETIVPEIVFPTFSGPESDFEVDVPATVEDMGMQALGAAGTAKSIREDILLDHENDEEDFEQLVEQVKEKSKKAGLPYCSWEVIPFPWDDNAPVTIQNLTELYAKLFVFYAVIDKVAGTGVSVAEDLKESKATLEQIQYKCEDIRLVRPELVLEKGTPDLGDLSSEPLDQDVFTYLFLEDTKLYFTQVAESLGRFTLAETPERLSVILG